MRTSKVFDMNDLPERRLSVKAEIAIDHATDFGEVIRYTKETLAMQLAKKILDSESFFYERGDKAGGMNFLTYGVDCVVLTAEELCDIKRESFKDGARHAQGYMDYRGMK